MRGGDKKIYDDMIQYDKQKFDELLAIRRKITDDGTGTVVIGSRRQIDGLDINKFNDIKKYYNYIYKDNKKDLNFTPTGLPNEIKIIIKNELPHMNGPDGLTNCIDPVLHTLNPTQPSEASKEDNNTSVGPTEALSLMSVDPNEACRSVTPERPNDDAIGSIPSWEQLVEQAAYSRYLRTHEENPKTNYYSAEKELIERMNQKEQTEEFKQSVEDRAYYRYIHTGCDDPLTNFFVALNHERLLQIFRIDRET
eukprot:GHVR01110480.1.p1 GENE.GHVR01110480.1~~GHVR01110480.1.p1  ORF type:complete len:252 (+),score=45.30 GHVR01110480.1:74-829(+)